MSPLSEHVSVILITHNSLPVLDTCLRHLRNALDAYSHELIVVDNNSRTDPSEAVKAFFPQATVLRNRSNYGFAAACNQAAREATGAYLLFVNPDVAIDSDAVGPLLEVAGKTGSGLVGGRLRFPDNRFQATCRHFPKATNLIFSRGSLITRLFGDELVEEDYRYTLPDYKTVTEVPAVAGTLLMIRRELFERLKGFDPRFFMYMEDTDLSLRAHQLARVNYFVPNAGGVHRWGTGSTSGRAIRAWWHHWSLWQYFLKHEPNGFSLVLLPMLLGLHFILSLIALPFTERDN